MATKQRVASAWGGVIEWWEEYLLLYNWRMKQLTYQRPDHCVFRGGIWTESQMAPWPFYTRSVTTRWREAKLTWTRTSLGQEENPASRLVSLLSNGPNYPRERSWCLSQWENSQTNATNVAMHPTRQATHLKTHGSGKRRTVSLVSMSLLSNSLCLAVKFLFWCHITLITEVDHNVINILKLSSAQIRTPPALSCLLKTLSLVTVENSRTNSHLCIQKSRKNIWKHTAFLFVSLHSGIPWEIFFVKFLSLIAQLNCPVNYCDGFLVTDMAGSIWIVWSNFTTTSFRVISAIKPW